MNQPDENDRSDTEPPSVFPDQEEGASYNLDVSSAREAKETAIRWFFKGSGITVIVILLGIFVLLAVKSWPAIRELGIMEFLGSQTWKPTSIEQKKYGILSLFVSTMMVTVGSMIIAIPLGIGCAAYLSEVASHTVREILKPAIEILASLPSVVIGFLGITILGPAIADFFGISNGLNAVNGSILLAVMSLPTIISLSEDAMNAVPDNYREASMGLGASDWQTTWKMVIPSSLSGIIAAVMLGMGRSVGETMAVLMATGNSPAMPSGFLDSVRTMTATIAVELGEVPYGSTHYHALFVVGLVLFLITFLINLAADLFLERARSG